MSGLNLTGRGRLSAMFASFGACLALLAVGASSAFAGTNCGPPDSLSGSCFAAGDGNQADGPGDLVDWQSYVPLAALADGPKGSDSKYKGGSKELEPSGWDFITGNNTPKTDILNGWGRLDAGFLNVAFTRVKQNGNTYLGFEMNQKAAGTAGGGRESGGIPVPNRSTGDVLITYDISTTNKISVGMCLWSGDSGAGDWLRLDGTPVGPSVKGCTHLDPSTVPSAMGAVNFGQALSAAQNWLEDHNSGIGAGQFGEASVNLNGLPAGAGNFLTDPCGPNGWFWMHSRASDTVTSQPKDILPGKPIADPTCGLTIDKKVSLSGDAGTFTDADQQNPLAAEVGDTVTYSMTLENTGTAALSVDLNDPRCDTGTITGPNGRDGSGDPLAAGESVTYTCTHLLTGTDPDPFENVACTTGTATLGSASKTLGLNPTICDSAWVDIFQPGELAKVTGSKFQDTNGNGAHDGDEGPLGGFVFYVDYNGNGALDPGEPAAVSSDVGQWQISGVKPGDWPVREVADANFTCTMPADGCSRTVTFTAGQTSDAGEFGNKPNQVLAPETPGQVVLGERIGAGRARLLGPSGCRARAFHARVAGTKIAKVVFILDGKTIKTLRKVNFHKTFAVRINPRHLRIGVHRLIAKVTFQRGSGTKAKQFRLSFQRCPRALRAPRFTG